MTAASTVAWEIPDCGIVRSQGGLNPSVKLVYLVALMASQPSHLRVKKNQFLDYFIFDVTWPTELAKAVQR